MNRKIEAPRSRFLSTRKLTTGLRFLDESSHQIIVTRQTPATTANRTIQVLENQSFEFPSSSTHCSEPMPTVRSEIPSQSTLPRLRVCPGGSLRKVVTRKVDAIPIGILM